MLLSSKAVEKLKDVTTYSYYPYTTHEQRNGLARMFIQETERLLDQKAESTIKYQIELYNNGKISYEEYAEKIELLSREEEARGAAQGGEYARNRVFDFAQKELDKQKERLYSLSLIDAKKQYEIEKKQAEKAMIDVTQQCIASIQIASQQYEEECKTKESNLQEVVDQHITTISATAQKQKQEFLDGHRDIITRTQTQVEQIVSTQLQEERDRREKEIYEQESLKPAREATRLVEKNIERRRRDLKIYKISKLIVIVIGVCLFLGLIINLILTVLPPWMSLILLIMVTLIFIGAMIWKSSISEESLTNDEREIMLFQTRDGDYATGSEEERCALLIKKVGL